MFRTQETVTDKVLELYKFTVRGQLVSNTEPANIIIVEWVPTTTNAPSEYAVTDINRKVVCVTTNWRVACFSFDEERMAYYKSFPDGRSNTVLGSKGPIRSVVPCLFLKEEGES